MTNSPDRSSADSEGPYAWRCCDRLHPYIYGIVTDRQVTADAWRESGIEFQALYPAPAQQATEYAWLIEAGWTGTASIEYWCGCEVTGGGGILHQWSFDHSRAIRFARKEDAKRMASILIDGEAYRVVEHGWDAAQPPAAPVDRRENETGEEYELRAGRVDARSSAGTDAPLEERVVDAISEWVGETDADHLRCAAKEAIALVRTEPQTAREWRLVETVGDLVNNLLTLDQEAPIYGAYFINNFGRKECRTRSVTVSRERVYDNKIGGDGPNFAFAPYCAVIWSARDER